MEQKTRDFITSGLLGGAVGAIGASLAAVALGADMPFVERIAEGAQELGLEKAQELGIYIVDSEEAAKEVVASALEGNAAGVEEHLETTLKAFFTDNPDGKILFVDGEFITFPDDTSYDLFVESVNRLEDGAERKAAEAALGSAIGTEGNWHEALKEALESEQSLSPELLSNLSPIELSDLNAMSLPDDKGIVVLPDNPEVQKAISGMEDKQKETLLEKIQEYASFDEEQKKEVLNKIDNEVLSNILQNSRIVEGVEVSQLHNPSSIPADKLRELVDISLQSETLANGDSRFIVSDGKIFIGNSDQLEQFKSAVEKLPDVDPTREKLLAAMDKVIDRGNLPKEEGIIGSLISNIQNQMGELSRAINGDLRTPPTTLEAMVNRSGGEILDITDGNHAIPLESGKYMVVTTDYDTEAFKKALDKAGIDISPIDKGKWQLMGAVGGTGLGMTAVGLHESRKNNAAGEQGQGQAEGQHVGRLKQSGHQMANWREHLARQQQSAREQVLASRAAGNQVDGIYHS